MDSDQHHQRADSPEFSHRSVDWQRNDRLGRIQRHLFEHRRAILRGYTNRNANTNSYADPNPNSNGYGDCHSNSDDNSYSNSNCDGNTDRDTASSDADTYCETQSDSAASPDSGAAPVDARVDWHRNKNNHGFR